MSVKPACSLWQLSATELAIAYGQGVATPNGVLEATLERLEAVNPRLNAVIALDAIGARAAAAASTQRWQAGRPRSGLDGVPVTIKDSLFARGLPATWGSRLYATHIPETDELPVARLRDTGAVLVGKTNVPELTVQGYTDNLLFGPTRNPWNTALTPGGSSGGAVAAVAAGIGPLALCTDGGGSIRRPASHAGLVGFKPSRGVVPRSGGFPAILLDFEVVGPIARCVEDIIIVMRTVGDPRIAWPSLGNDQPRFRILFAPTFGNAPVDPEIAASVAAAAIKLEQLGHHVEKAERFELAEPLGNIWPVISQTGVAWLRSQHADWDNNVGAAIAAMADAGAKFSAVQYLEALDAVAAMRRAFDELFQHHDLLLTPTTAALPWPATETHPPVIAGQPVGARGHAVFTPFANATGLPAISVPCAPSSGGMPIGFQLAGAFGADARVISAALEYQNATSIQYQWPPT